ncbi:TetR/AcrR family transcriptional regulator [Streptomyces sp. NPDC005356]|uniref:TetR/AcrR family transcriptional regulator n=1 Tax=Streptomyces sp. NPDC005356 TaxID=3157167 RepID=UPI0033B85109
MAPRGSYAKGIAKREEILNTALDIVARVGYSRTTVRELAQAVGLSQPGLLHYFGTKEQLFIEILRRRDQVDEAEYSPATRTADGPPDLFGGVTSLVDHNAQVPGLVQLYSRFSSEATEESHPAHEYFRDRYATARAGGAAAIREQQEAGTLPASLDADRLAVLMFALIDGLQSQWMYDSEIDMADQLAYFRALLTGETTCAETDLPSAGRGKSSPKMPGSGES